MPGSTEAAEHSRKIAGVISEVMIESSTEHDLLYGPRVYLKTHDVTGSEGFLRCARHFFAGILTYFKEK